MAHGRRGGRARDERRPDLDKFREMERPAKPASTEKPSPRPFDPRDFERSAKPESTSGWPYKRD